MSVEESLSVIRDIFSNGHTWALELKQTGEPVGCMGYYAFGESNIEIGEDDSQYEQGKTYYFHVVDEDTISSEEKVSSNTVMVNFYTRFNGSGLSTKSSMDEPYSTNTLIIMYDVEVGKDPLLAAVKEFGAEILYDYNIIPGMAVRIPDGSDIQKAIVYFKQVKGVVSVERDQIHRLTDPVRPRIETM